MPEVLRGEETVYWTVLHFLSEICQRSLFCFLEVMILQTWVSSGLCIKQMSNYSKTCTLQDFESIINPGCRSSMWSHEPKYEKKNNGKVAAIVWNILLSLYSPIFFSVCPIYIILWPLEQVLHPKGPETKGWALWWKMEPTEVRQNKPRNQTNYEKRWRACASFPAYVSANFYLHM